MERRLTHGRDEGASGTIWPPAAGHQQQRLPSICNLLPRIASSSSLPAAMSTTSLPSYVAPDLTRTPSYTAEPQAYEQRLALNVLRARPAGEFTKHSRGGGVSLRLFDQDDNAELPVYGHAASIDGVVQIARPEGVQAVEVKVRRTWDRRDGHGSCAAPRSKAR